MVKTDPSAVEEYIASQPGTAQVALKRVRSALSEPVPVRLIQRIAKFRERETLAKAKAKVASRR